MKLIEIILIVFCKYTFIYAFNDSQIKLCMRLIWPVWALSLLFLVNGIGAVVMVVDSHPCGWGSIPGKSCSFLIASLSKSLSLYFMYSDQHVKYRIPRGFPLTSSLLLDYHVKQYIQQYTHYLAKQWLGLWKFIARIFF